MNKELTELEDYQEWVHSTSAGAGASWAAMGIASEAGEVLSHFEKSIRRDQEVNIDEVIDEIGDVLWFTAELCNSLNITLDEVILRNIEKLNERRSGAEVQ